MCRTLVVHVFRLAAVRAATEWVPVHAEAESGVGPGLNQRDVSMRRVGALTAARSTSEITRSGFIS